MPIAYNMFSHSSEVRVEGLETLDYFDSIQSKTRCTEQGDAVVFESEVSLCSSKLYGSKP
jgi:glucose-6-phosphate 1-epimerase